MEINTEQIRQNLECVCEQIERACAAANRPSSSVCLLVVTKAQPVEKIQAAYQAGARKFGENYPEESTSKIEALKGQPGVEWHMIGHLQSRKARLVAGSFDMLHSLDSLSLAEKLDRLLGELGQVLPVLLEVNVGGEESKSGFPAWQDDCWEDLYPEFEKILSLKHLRVQGLMSMPPLFEDPESVRPYFQKVRRLRDDLSRRFQQAHWDELSMGTSIDYPVAIQEGATYIRVGTAIMGARLPRKSKGD